MHWALVVLLLCSTQLVADEGTEFLRKFRKNPRQWMNKKPTKYRQDGTKIKKVRSWPKHTRTFQMRNAEIKDAINKDILGEGKQGWEAHDNPRYLFESGVHVETNIMRLPAEGKLSFTPWSSYYWPIATGGISMRYADPDFDDLKYEEDNYELLVSYYKQPTDFLRLQPFAEERQKQLDMYSPAEKYDLLVGSSDFKLTNQVKEQGRKYMDEDGSVAMWMGICHGWAVAAYASPRPKRSVAVKAADSKTTVNFYPDDLRALVSLKWASASSWDGLFIGGRCNISEYPDDDDDKKLNIDEETGRVLDAECFDTNPGTWHTVITNKIGRYNESFIMDVTFDAEVWNQPVYSYSVEYYHPRTEKPGTLEESIMTIDEQWKKEDTFAAFRNNDRAKKIVLVKMEVEYVVETSPRRGESDPDDIYSVSYWYDLELDAQNNIIGGEWLSNYHPDFLWTKKRNSRPQNTIDRTISRLFDAKKTVSKFVASRDINVFNKAMLGRLSELSDLSVRMDNTPLELITYGLVELSR